MSVGSTMEWFTVDSIKDANEEIHKYGNLYDTIYDIDIIPYLGKWRKQKFLIKITHSLPLSDDKK